MSNAHDCRACGEQSWLLMYSAGTGRSVMHHKESLELSVRLFLVSFPNRYILLIASYLMKLYLS